MKALREHDRDGGMAASDMREQGRELEPERPTIEPVVHPERCTMAIANSGPSKRPVEGENKSNDPIYKGGARGGIPQVTPGVAAEPELPWQRLPLVKLVNKVEEEDFILSMKVTKSKATFLHRQTHLVLSD